MGNQIHKYGSILNFHFTNGPCFLLVCDTWITKYRNCNCVILFFLVDSGRVIGADAGKRGGYIARMTSPPMNMTSDMCLHFDYYVADGARLDISMADPDATLFNRTR